MLAEWSLASSAAFSGRPGVYLPVGPGAFALGPRGERRQEEGEECRIPD